MTPRAISRREWSTRSRLAEFVVAADVQAGRLVPVLEDWHRVEPLPVYALYPHRRHLSPKVRAFVDFLVEACTPQPPWRRTPPGMEPARHPSHKV